MAKKKKNSNYVTPKTEAAKAQKLREEKKKKIMKVVKICIWAFVALAVIAGIVLGVGFGFGLFEYAPEVTDHVSIEIEGYGEVHIELYGKVAPKTVEKFKTAVNNYKGKSVTKFMEDIVALGGTINIGTVDELYNGSTNKISHARGTLSVIRSSSSSGQVFIARKNMRSLDGQYAAFGRITTGMRIIDKIYKDLEKNPSANIIIKNASYHAADSH